MTKEHLSAKMLKLGSIIGTCGGMAQALGDSEHPNKWLILGLLIGLALTLHEWRTIASIIISEYKRLKKLESDKEIQRCDRK